MTVVSDSVTASQMRDEVVEELTRRHEQACSSLANMIGSKRTQRKIAFQQGYAGALAVQLDFWLHVFVRDGAGNHRPHASVIALSATKG